MRLMLLSLALIGAPAFAEEAPSRQSDPDRMICKKITPTGSRVGGVKKCATAAEWKEVARKGRDFTKGIQDRGGRIGMPKGG